MMMRTLALPLLLVAWAVTFVPGAHSAGPMDGEIGAAWWANDFDSSNGVDALSGDATAPGFQGELWFVKKYGVRAELFSSELDELDVDAADYVSLDLLWRAISPTENNFLAIGLGWQDIEIGGVGDVGLNAATSGVRLCVEGRVAMGGLFQLYGQGAYMPELDDAAPGDPAAGRLVDLEGYQYEVGVSWRTAPFLALRAGYRAHSFDFTRTGMPLVPGELPGTVESEGYLMGLRFRF